MENLIQKQWPALSIYVGILLSMLIAIAVDFRFGAIALSLCVLGAFLFRLYLPDAQAGWLQSRRRRVDLTFLAALGVALLILALVVPHR
jgi:hypothetical protein